MSIKELLAVLRDEVSEAEEVMRSAVDAWRDAAHQGIDSSISEAQAAYTDQIARVRDVAAMLELSGVETLCFVLEENLATFASSSHALPAGLFDQLLVWPGRLIEHLARPHDRACAEALIAVTADALWPQPLDAELSDEILVQLCSDIESSGSDPAGAAPRTPMPEEGDVLGLEFAPDLPEELIESFLLEAPRHASHYSSVMAEVALGRGDISAIDEARRVIHTLKGAANTVGIRAIGAICHQTEDILERLVRCDAPPDPALSDLLIRVADCIDAMVGSLLGEEPPPEQRGEILNEVRAAAERLDRPTAQAPEPSAEEAIEIPDVEPPRSTTPESTPEPAQTQPTEQARRAGVLNIPTRQIDTLVRVAGEITLGHGRVRTLLTGCIDALDALEDQNRRLHERIYTIEQLIDVQGVSAGHHPASESAEAFDALELDRYNALHTHTHSFIESFADFGLMSQQLRAELDALQGTLSRQSRQHQDLQRGLLESRMVPASRLAERLKRAVRHTCHQLGKDVALRLSGESVLIDSYVLAELAEPLMHLVRNAIDHAIEPQQERERLGKRAQGLLEIRFAREGDKVVIRCRDDGRGFDYAQIRHKALELGLIHDDTELSEQALAQFILHPGFSTAAEVTSISGRGIGMDVIHAAIQALKGTLDMSSQPGEGAEFTLRLPLTLGVVHALLTEVAHRIVAFPVDELERVVHRGTRQIERLGSDWVYRSGQDALQVDLAGPLLGYGGQAPLDDTAAPERPVLIVKAEFGQRLAFVVDQVLDADDMVLEQPSRYLEQLPGLIGLTLRGDGHIVPVVDVRGLLAHTQHRELPGVETTWAAHTEASADEDILIVDDSLSVRNSLSQLLLDAGYQVRTAKDGLEAVDVIADRQPAIVLLDLEMPRMNGIELTEHLRAREATRSLPIIMITSRSQDKHRKRAEVAGVNAYLTKPCQEFELLDLLRAYLV